MMVGELLDHLDKLGVADNTIVMYSTDNGPHYNTWPDAAITPFRSEEYELGGQFPRSSNGSLAWRIKEGQVINEIMSHEDWVPTLMAAAGRPNVVAELKAGVTVDGKPYRITSMVTTFFRYWRVKRILAHETRFFTGAMTVY